MALTLLYEIAILLVSSAVQLHWNIARVVVKLDW